MPPRLEAERPRDLRGLILANLVVLGIAACFFLVYRFATALFSLFVGVTLGMAVKPAVEWLHRRGVPRWAAALAVYAALSSILVTFVVLVMPAVVDQVAKLLADAPATIEKARRGLEGSPSRLLRRASQYLPGALSRDAAEARGAALRGAGQLLPTLGVLGASLLSLAAVLLLGIFWNLEGERRIRELVFLAPLERRREIRAFFIEVERKVGAYIRGQTLVCFVMGVLAFGAYRLIGLPYAFVLGVIYGAGEAVPVLGPMVGALAACAVALSVNPASALWVLFAAVLLQVFENYLLIPRVMRRAVGVNPVVTLLAITGFGSVLGVAGAVLAIPMAAIVQLLIDRFLLRSDEFESDLPAGRNRTSALRYEVQQVALDVRKLLRGRQGAAPAAQAEKIEDSVETIAADLDRLLARREGRP